MSILGSKKPAEPEVVPAPTGLTVIAVGVAVRGSVDSNGTVKVEGSVEGDVTSRAQLLVAKGGIVEGDVIAREAIVGGTVTGSIRAQDRVEIQAGAVVEGDITTRRIMVAEGASLNGQVRMGEDAQLPAPATGHATVSAGTLAPSPPVPVPPRMSMPIARVAVSPRPSTP
jgi:cytoskeletal protein CcmA (bactofilin family)